MRVLALLLLCVAPQVVLAQQGATIYGGMDVGYGIVQMREENRFSLDTFHTANGVAFLGYGFASGWATEVAYLQTRKKHAGMHTIQMNLVDIALLYHSKTYFPGFFARSSLGWMTLQADDNTRAAPVRSKEHDQVISFGLGYEHQASRHVALRMLHTTYLAWRGERMNTLKVGIKLTY